MYHDLLRRRELFERLLGIDSLIAAGVQAEGCRCGGRLDRASYPRKPRGLPKGLDREYARRESFCCCEEGCRRRATPVSVRFLGRRVYVGVAVVVAAAEEMGVSQGRVRLLADLMEWPVDRRTVQRWVSWWREALPRTRWWQGIRGRLRAPVDPRGMPLSILQAFEGKSPEEAVVGLLGLLTPISIGHAG